MLEDLPVKRVEYTLEDTDCPQCDGSLHIMSQEVRKEIAIIPAQVKVVEHVRHVYTCRACEQTEEHPPVITAPMPNPVLPGSFVSPSFMSYVMNRKYGEGLPLYRQEQQLHHFGLDISRQTLANWMVHGAFDWLDILYERLHQEMLTKDILHGDETELQVLREEGRTAANKSYMWHYATGHTDHPSACMSTRPPGPVNTRCLFLKDLKDTCTPTGIRATTRFPGFWSSAAGRIIRAICLSEKKC